MKVAHKVTGEHGDYPVDVEIKEHPTEPHVIIMIASCGETKREHSVTLGATHERSDEQFESDLQQQIRIHALRTAGYEHSRKQREKLFREGIKGIKQDQV